MNFLPKASGTRPRVACEIAPGGVVAARLGEAPGVLSAVAMEKLADGAIAPGLRPGNVADRVAVAAAVRKTLEQVGAKPNTRNADITVVIPDGACRVLLLDFDALPNKLSEALPLVRFRLKKLVPFDADDAMVSFQVMSTSKTIVRVLAVAIPRDVLSEYETAAREAGFEPGAVVPSTLASMAALEGHDTTALVVNVSRLGVTTAIQRDGILLLHRTVDLQVEPSGVPANMPAALFEPAGPTGVDEFAHLPLVSVEETAGEWAAQEPLPEHGRNPYADRASDESVVEDEDGITTYGVPAVYVPEELAAVPAYQPGDSAHSPYASPTMLADMSAELHNAVLLAPTSPGTLTDPAALYPSPHAARPAVHDIAANEIHEYAHEAEPLPAGEFASEVAQAVSVAAAYFEDTLAESPQTLLTAGSLGADGLQRILRDSGVAEADGLKVRDLVGPEAILAEAVSVRIPRGSLSGVLGALLG
jgi:type IV pilus assembly protein PilM